MLLLLLFCPSCRSNSCMRLPAFQFVCLEKQREFEGVGSVGSGHDCIRQGPDFVRGEHGRRLRCRHLLCKFEGLVCGIILTKANYGDVLKRNQLTNVVPQVDINYLDATGTNIVILPGSFNRGPFFPAGSSVTVAYTASGEIGLIWTPALDAVDVAGYNIYVNNSLTGITAAGVHSYTVSGLTPKTVYTFTVKSVDAAGHESISLLRLTESTEIIPYDNHGRTRGTSPF